MPTLSHRTFHPPSYTAQPDICLPVKASSSLHPLTYLSVIVHSLQTHTYTHIRCNRQLPRFSSNVGDVICVWMHSESVSQMIQCILVLSIRLTESLSQFRMVHIVQMCEL
ncbi:hypothetical protein Smp_178170 [Schistosoma mansoni]|uniref:Ovule protein n=1 Tax=Schistosoma mansoni TaxID=6183 RepID=G4LV21_SCHMA|nr:hypothetical protein Smp_178170 [Schistosoma mansoni]|eukprot:XP_018645123.1 hypothetical protein Smp_178170 [Schistosoma mansoni]